jgi:transcription antitermination factor NusG
MTAGTETPPVRTTPIREGNDWPIAGVEPSWYVVRSKPHKESYAQIQLELRRIDVFMPKLALPQYVKHRRTVVPLFPSYLFVRLALPHRYHDVLWAPGIQGFVAGNGGPLPLDDGAVEFLRDRATPDGVIGAEPKLRPGQEVEILEGPFAGLIGIITRPPDTKGRIKVLMQLLNRAVTVDVPLRAVKAEWVPKRLGI